jgi:hypothetical protein
MGRLVQAMVAAVVLLSCSDGMAQWYGGWYGYGNWGGYYYGESSTPYSSAVRAEAEMAKALGQEAESLARAAETNERARSQYLENQARFVELRRQQKVYMETQKYKREEEGRQKFALRPPAKPHTVMYPRLSADQLDPQTGHIHWPAYFLTPEFESERKIIEGALKEQAEHGPEARTSKILFDAAYRMESIRSPSMRSLSSQEYAAAHKFLKSLAHEGEHALEAMK